MCGHFSSCLFPVKKRQNMKFTLLFLSVLLIFIQTRVMAAETIALSAEADLLLSTNDYAGALAEYQRTVTRAVEDKDYFLAKVGVGMCQAALKQTEAAKATFKNLLYEHPDLDDDRAAIRGYTGLVDLTDCRATEPIDAADNLVQGIYLFSEKDYPAARGKYQRFMEHYPADRTAYYVQYQLGRTYFREKDYKRAAAEFRKTANDYPLSKKAGSAEWIIGYCRHYQENYGEAIAQFQKFILDYPDHHMITDAKERLASLIHLVGEKDDNSQNWLLAYAIYSNMAEELAETEPERAGYAQMQKAAMVLEMAKRREHGFDYKDAIEECEKVLVIKETAPLDKAKALLMKGESYYYQGDRDNALECFLTVLEDYEKGSNCKLACGAAHVMAGIIYNRSGETDNAIKHFDEVIKKYKKGPNFADRNVYADALLWKMDCLRKSKSVINNRNEFNDIAFIAELLMKEFPDSHWSEKAGKIIRNH
jgi:TolA-binding protein